MSKRLSTIYSFNTFKYKIFTFYSAFAVIAAILASFAFAFSFKAITEAELAKELREQYIKNPPEGMTSDEVRDMDDEELLDMDYFLHEFNDLDDDDFGEEGFYIF
ncbi:MAG: hypothetical protein EGQ79_06890 [Ruminococcus sp.]|nr:hypothetical protein [Ruminococcus sp.]